MYQITKPTTALSISEYSENLVSFHLILNVVPNTNILFSLHVNNMYIQRKILVTYSNTNMKYIMQALIIKALKISQCKVVANVYTISLNTKSLYKVLYITFTKMIYMYVISKLFFIYLKLQIKYSSPNIYSVPTKIHLIDFLIQINTAQ